MAYDGTQPKQPISKWWPIGVLIGAIVFFAIGGGLAGAWSNSVATFCLNNYSGYGYSGYLCAGTGDMGLWDGAIACLIIGALLKLTFWILIIVFCVQRRRVRYHNNSYYNNTYTTNNAHNVEKGNANQTLNYTQNVPMVAADIPPPNNSASPAQELGTENEARNFCGQCGTPAAGAFCTNCSAQM